jgi:hypothetical protein
LIVNKDAKNPQYGKDSSFNIGVGKIGCLYAKENRYIPYTKINSK